ncbi:YihY/virulence factor BrkB family protein OS=Streptomyces rimosus subsp. rimosus (strain ATCC / DSM 40260 / JCM 4667 / NRRL 2234) OX=1265868 GN=SRIM_032390 PE=4 SV=1 [Streptomyces rimosus subsp. rimosus]
MGPGSPPLRVDLTETVEGPTIYGSLAAPVAVLLWIGVSAFAVLVGAAMNAALDRVWPSVATAAGRAEKEHRAREVAAAQRAALTAVGLGSTAADDPPTPDDEEDDDTEDDDTPPPAEYPERWAEFLPPVDIKARLYAYAKRRGRH